MFKGLKIKSPTLEKSAKRNGVMLQLTALGLKLCRLLRGIFLSGVVLAGGARIRWRKVLRIYILWVSLKHKTENPVASWPSNTSRQAPQRMSVPKDKAEGEMTKAYKLGNPSKRAEHGFIIFRRISLYHLRERGKYKTTYKEELLHRAQHRWSL